MVFRPESSPQGVASSVRHSKVYPALVARSFLTAFLLAGSGRLLGRPAGLTVLKQLQIVFINGIGAANLKRWQASFPNKSLHAGHSDA